MRTAGAHLVHLQTCGNDRGTPGGDQTDWAGLSDALEAIDYPGPVTIESFTGDNEAIAVAASIWRPLATSQDELTRDGLAFLRSMEACRAVAIELRRPGRGLPPRSRVVSHYLGRAPSTSASGKRARRAGAGEEGRGGRGGPGRTRRTRRERLPAGSS